MNFLDEAAFYVSLGWKVYPTMPGSKIPFPGSKGVREASDDADVIAEWHRREPRSNISVNCGLSGLLVLDLDPRHGCWKTIEAWERQRKVLPMTVHSRTRAGGLHLFFALAKPLPDGWKRKFEGIDIQTGHKGAHLPPSEIWADKVDDGIAGNYEWLRAPKGSGLPSPPRWLFDLMRPPPAPRFTGKKSSPADVEKRLSGILQRIVTTKSGRNNELNRQAHLVGRMIAEEGVNQQEAEARLLEAGLTANPDIGRYATLATIRSGIRSGMRHAGEPHKA